MAHLRGAGGLLDSHTAAVEVINAIRPIVAIAWYIVFAALALHEHPGAAEHLRREPLGRGAGDDAYIRDRPAALRRASSLRFLDQRSMRSCSVSGSARTRSCSAGC